MEVIPAIHSRHAIKKMKPDPLPRETIETLLSAAVQAPNHHKVRPWRFVVITGAGLVRLGQVMADSFKARFPDVPPEVLQKEAQKPLRAPLIIAVAADLPEDPRIDLLENICAASAACQNILLAAHGLELGAIWRSGDASRDPSIKQFLGFSVDQPLLGFLYIGFPDMTADPAQRPSYEDRTTWME